MGRKSGDFEQLLATENVRFGNSSSGGSGRRRSDVNPGLPNPPSTRTGGQDDGSMQDKLPQTKQDFEND